MNSHITRNMIRRSGTLLSGTLCTLIAMLSATHADAGIVHWASPIDGFFSAPGFWNPLGVPDFDDDAHFTHFGSYTVDFTQTEKNRSFLVQNGNVTFNAVNAVSYDLATSPLNPARIDFNGALTLTGGAPMTVNIDSGSADVPFQVGNTSVGTLTIENGSQLRSFDEVIFAFNAISSANIAVTGDGSQVEVIDNPLVVGFNGPAQVSVLNGGRVSSDELITLGSFIQGDGQVYVNGPTSQLNVFGSVGSGGELVIGNVGKGDLFVENGATALAQSRVVLGMSEDGIGTADVIHPGSLLVGDAFLQVGMNGEGVLNILDGGEARAGGFVTIGTLFNSTGTVNVDGVGSRLEGNHASGLTTEGIIVGQNGIGHLNVTNGAIAASPGGNVRIASEAGSVGSATITGGSSLQVTGSADIYVGQSGTGALSVTDSAATTGRDIFMASNPGSTGTATVTGGSGNFSGFGQMIIGDHGEAELDVLDGAIAGGLAGVTIARQPGSVADVTLDGQSSTLQAFDTLRIGDSGSASLSILNGGQAVGTNTELASKPGSEGHVTVSGNNTLFSGGSVIAVGGTVDGTEGGSASVLIQQGGQMESGSLIVYPNGNVELNDGMLQASSIDLMGSLNSETAVNINADITHEGLISGPVQLFVGTPDPDTLDFDYIRLTGDVTGQGGYFGNVRFAGSFDPSPNIEQTEFTNVMFDESAVINIDLQGEVPGITHDHFAPEGVAYLGGTLNVRTCCEFPSIPGLQFEILSALIIDGEFDSIQASTLAEGLEFDVIYTDSSVILELVLASDCDADLNGDGSVGPADLAQLLGSWGPNPGAAADLTGDGSVGPADLAQLLGNWGPCK